MPVQHDHLFERLHRVALVLGNEPVGDGLQGGFLAAVQRHDVIHGDVSNGLLGDSEQRGNKNVKR